MPTMILALTWLLASTTQFAAAPAPSPTETAAAALVPTDPPSWAGLLATDLGDRGWLLIESETDDDTDDDDPALDAPGVSWSGLRWPFGVAISNPHPTVIPRSALRSPILRC